MKTWKITLTLTDTPIEGVEELFTKKEIEKQVKRSFRNFDAGIVARLESVEEVSSVPTSTSGAILGHADNPDAYCIPCNEYPCKMIAATEQP